MKPLKILYFLMNLIFILLNVSCKKEWLNGKPNQSLTIPSTVADYQALLDNSEVMNQNYSSLYMLGDGDFYVSDTRYNGLTPPEMGAYIWSDTKDFYGGEQNYDWQATYTIVLNANVVLDGLNTISVNSQNLNTYNNAKGSALFYRSLCFYTLAQEFCKPYNSLTSNNDLGLPLRTSANINIALSRSSVQQTYDQLIGDLLTAVPLLPVSQSHITRPSKAAAYGLLSRVYLSQNNYGKALLYADSSLQINNKLMDFNNLSASAAFPISRFNNETLFYYDLGEWLAFRQTRLIVDSNLYKSYNGNDLRSKIYFVAESSGYSFKGSYDGDQLLFGGLATDEMYLNRAESFARTGNITAAMSDLNTLLKSRWLTGTYNTLVAANAGDALALILTERRKELCFRGLRWTDLRRLNTDTRFQTTLTRFVSGQSYSLIPNSPKYVLPIDDYEIQIGGLQQNPR